MRTKRRLAVLASLVGLMSIGAAQSVFGQEARLQGRIPDPTRGEIDAILVAARDAGIPTEPLVDRALEGASKGADGALILRAVRRLDGELRLSWEALGSVSTEAEIVAGASALRAGAQPDDLAELRSMRGDQPLTVATAVLADLVAVGVPVDTAVAAVLTLAEGVDDAEYIAFRQNVERDIALGASPVSALGVRLDMAAEALNQSADRSPSQRPRIP
jgi:hypothetical protein